MNQTSKTIGKLMKFSGPFRITILLSAVFSAFSAVINLKAYLCVYEVAKVLIRSSGNFVGLDLAAMKALGMQAVWYVCMGFGMYGMVLLCSHISAYNTVALILTQLIRHLGTLPLGYHILHPSGKQRKIIEKNTDNLEILIAHNIPDYVQSLVPEFILKAKRYGSASAAIFAYAICSVGANANVMRFAFMTEIQLAEKTAYYGHEYMDIISGYFSHGYMLPLIAVTAFTGGVLGGLLGKAVLKKHFVKSGMI